MASLVMILLRVSNWHKCPLVVVMLTPSGWVGHGSDIAARISAVLATYVASPIKPSSSFSRRPESALRCASIESSWQLAAS